MSIEKTSPIKYRPDIDGLRALAVLAVVIFHAFPEYFSGGFIGVDIFFVISGFLITSILLKNFASDNFSILNFYIHRILRIFPALLTVLAFSFIFGWYGLLADEFKSLSLHIIGGVAFIANFIFWNESGYFDNFSGPKPLLHLWSLGVEEQFYILWPLLLLLASRSRKSVLFGIYFLGFASFLYSIYLIQQNPIAAFFSPISRFWELLIGAALAYPGLTTSRSPPPRYKEFMSWLGLGLIVYGVALITPEKSFPGLLALLPTLGTALIILGGPTSWLNHHILSSRIAVSIGLISYPLYLWHWPLLSLARIIEGGFLESSLKIAICAISIIFAWLTYLLIEKPLKKISKKGLLALSLLVLMSCMGLLAHRVYQKDGLPLRPAEAVKAFNQLNTKEYAASCEALIGQKDFDDWCHPGNGNMKNLNSIIIGDSFANAYVPMFLDYAQSSNHADVIFSQFGRAICPSLVGYGSAFCNQIAQKEREFALNHSTIKNIVIAGNWPHYNKNIHLQKGNVSESKENFQKSFEGTVNWYKKMGFHVIILLAPPTGVDPKSCLVRPIKLSHKNQCNLALEQAKKNDGDYREFMIPFLNKQGIPFLDPWPYLCTDRECKVIDGNKILMNDVWHLSAYGGQYLSQAAKKRLDELFKM